VEFKSIASFKKALDRDALDLACCGNMSFYHHGNERSWSLPPSLFQCKMVVRRHYRSTERL